jgi:hypothetical protein
MGEADLVDVEAFLANHEKGCGLKAVEEAHAALRSA